jgi:hypothetical protein
LESTLENTSNEIESSSDEDLLQDTNSRNDSNSISDHSITDDSDNNVSDNDSDQNNMFNNNDKIHPSLECSKSDCLLLILCFFLRHNLSWTALEHLLLLINTILGSVVLPNSKYLFKKVFQPDNQPILHYFCIKCNVLAENNDKKNNCKNCNEKINLNSSKNKNFFITLPILPQIKLILKNNFDSLILNNLPNENNLIRDLLDASMYKNLLLNFANEHILTLTMNTDGVSVFNSTKSGSFWPIQCIINELQPSKRFLQQNIIVVGFWFGRKPAMEIFFKPLLSELTNLINNSFNFIINDINYMFKVILPICTLDTLGKDQLQNKIPFNGKFGCSYCLHPGVNLARNDLSDELEEISNTVGFRSNHSTKTHRNLMRYPPLKNIQMRNHNSTLEDMRLAFLTKKTIRGLKGLSPMVAVPYFDLIFGFSIDYMHCCLLGIARQLAELWFHPNFHNESFYIGSPNLISKIDKRLLQIKPPQNVSRTPRSLKERAFWKANEWRNWLLFYGIPCLNEILNRRYLRHFALFSSSIFIFLRDDISIEQFNLASSNLTKFVNEFFDLYGAINLSYNCHLLLHIPECVKRWGPLWCYSNFCFEDSNGLLVSYVKGTTDVSKQIVNKYNLNKFLNNKSASHSETVGYFIKHTSAKKSTNNDIVQTLGKPSLLEIDQNDRGLFANFSIVELISFKRFIFNKTIFTDITYSRSLKTNDSLVETYDGTVGFIKSFFKENNSYYILLQNELGHESTDEIYKICKHLKKLPCIENVNKIFSVTDIKRKCVVIQKIPSLVYSFIPNKYERD